MSYGPHPNDFLFVECEKQTFQRHQVFSRADIGQTDSFSIIMIPKLYTSMILYFATSTHLSKMNYIYNTIMGMSFVIHYSQCFPVELFKVQL